MISYTNEQLDILKSQFSDLTATEFQYLIEVSKASGLNLFQRQLHGIKRGGKMSIQTGIDGYRLVAARTGLHAGTSDPAYQVHETGYPTEASVTVLKLLPNGQIGQFAASARWNEYAQQNSPMWRKMPFLMLGKCAEALALRKAFPGELSGIYTQEEMMQADSLDVVPLPQAGQQATQARQDAPEAIQDGQQATQAQRDASEDTQAPQDSQDDKITGQQARQIGYLWKAVFNSGDMELDKASMQIHMKQVTGKNKRQDLSVTEAESLIEALKTIQEGDNNGSN
jgi:phage recombination protein Bet